MGRAKPNKPRRDPALRIENRIARATREDDRRENLRAAFDEAFGDMTDEEIAREITGANQKPVSGN